MNNDDIIAASRAEADRRNKARRAARNKLVAEIRTFDPAVAATLRLR